MKVMRFSKVVAIAASLALVVAAAPASAQTKDEAKCRKTIAKNIGKYSATNMKTVVKCLKDRIKGKISTDCTDLDAADTKGKRTKAADKLRDQVGGLKDKCADKLAVPFTNVLDQFVRCQSPNAALNAGGGLDDTILDTFSELSECLIATSDSWTVQVAGKVFGQPADTLTGGVTKDASKCAGAVAKGVGKLMATIAKSRAKLQADIDKANVGNAIGTHKVASIGDFKGKNAKALQKLKDDIDKKCTLSTSAELGLVDMCGASATSLKNCAGDLIATSVGGGLSAIAWQIPSTCLVRGVKVFINPGASADHSTNTRLDTGTTGGAHGADLLSGYEGQVDILCDDECSNCNVDLTILPDTADNAYCRCANDPTVVCGVIAGADAANCSGLGGDECKCYFGPPLALSAAGVSTCVITEIVSELTGLADVGSGVSDTTVSSLARVHTGGSGTLQVPCPICDAGTCVGGEQDGGPCVPNGTNAGFGGDVSYDCQPAALTNTTGTGLSLDLVLSTGASSIAQDLSCGGALPGSNCWCRSCDADTTVGCNSTQDCVDAGVGGTCGNAGEPQAVPNTCADTICTPDGDGEGLGTCDGDAPNKFCDGQLQNSGKGIVPCTVDADCVALDSSCSGGDCGDCTVQEAHSCLIGTLSVAGDPSSLGAELATTFCVPQTGNAGINAAGGLPGPGRLKIDFDYDALCEDGTQAQAPGFVNCQP